MEVLAAAMLSRQPLGLLLLEWESQSGPLDRKQIECLSAAECHPILLKKGLHWPLRRHCKKKPKHGLLGPWVLGEVEEIRILQYRLPILSRSRSPGYGQPCRNQLLVVIARGQVVGFATERPAVCYFAANFLLY